MAKTKKVAANKAPSKKDIEIVRKTNAEFLARTTVFVGINPDNLIVGVVLREPSGKTVAVSGGGDLEKMFHESCMSIAFGVATEEKAEEPVKGKKKVSKKKTS